MVLGAIFKTMKNVAFYFYVCLIVNYYFLFIIFYVFLGEKGLIWFYSLRIWKIDQLTFFYGINFKFRKFHFNDTWQIKKHWILIFFKLKLCKIRVATHTGNQKNREKVGRKQREKTGTKILYRENFYILLFVLFV